MNLTIKYTGNKKYKLLNKYVTISNLNRRDAKRLKKLYTKISDRRFNRILIKAWRQYSLFGESYL